MYVCMRNEVCIVIENPCVTFTKIIRSFIPYFSDLCHNCQHELSGLLVDKPKKNVYYNSQGVC